MSTTSRELIQIPQAALMQEAKASLSGRWGLAVSSFLVYFLIVAASSFIPLVPILIGGPFALGIAIFSLKLGREQDAQLGNIFDGFQNFGTALAANLLMGLLIGIGMLFLIVPGVILALGLSQTMWILADEPELGPVDALKKSWEMTKGYKMDLFILGLRFIPWALLCILTLGIGIFWLMPYMQVTFSKFYDQIRAAHDPIERGDDITRHLVD